tara:strand:+ start:31 stop:996 length:966 start_codon:yes stop_codon:yes gene_type:complete
MSAYNQEFNKDNTIIRYLIVALLAELEKKVYYYNQVDEDTLTKINIPFLYSISGNERFLLDNFMFDAEAQGKAIGDYEVVPRGMIQMNSMSIDSSAQTNKFTRGEFVREYKGVLKTFALETNFLPITMGFGVTVVCSNNLEMLKVTEAVISKLYKTTLFSCDLGMMRVQASMAVPEDYQQDRLFEFGLNDKKEFQVTFDIELKSFMPVFETGVLLPEITKMTQDAISSNPDAAGVGLFRCNSNGEMGILFGGVFQKFQFTDQDIRLAPPDAIESNTRYVDPNKVQTGGPFDEREIDSSKVVPEPAASKTYRNANDESATEE